MNSLKKRFAVDLEAANDGIWFDIGDGVELKIARSNNKNFKKLAWEKVQKEKIKRVSKNGVFTAEEEDEVLADLVAETVLLDWKGIADDNGEPFEYSKERAKEMLLDPEMVEFAELIDRLASSEENFRKEFLAQAAQDAGE